MTSYRYNASRDLVEELAYATGLSSSEIALALIGDFLPQASALDQISRYTYNASGNVVTSTNAQGTLTTYGYGDDGQLTTKEAAAQTASARLLTIDYDVRGNVKAEIAPRDMLTGAQATKFYDAGNRLVRETNALDQTVLYLSLIHI